MALSILSYVFLAILIKASLPYVVVLTVGFFRWPLVANEVSLVWAVEDNINQLSKIGNNILMTYFLMKSFQFSVLILSGSFTIFDLKKRGGVCYVL